MYRELYMGKNKLAEYTVITPLAMNLMYQLNLLVLFYFVCQAHTSLRMTAHKTMCRTCKITWNVTSVDKLFKTSRFC